MKLCLFCENFDFEAAGFVYYSEETGGDTTGGYSCKKNHYFEYRPDDADDLKALLSKAESCIDYLQPLDLTSHP